MFLGLNLETAHLQVRYRLSCRSAKKAEKTRKKLLEIVFVVGLLEGAFIAS
jgi:hypothetical protein